MHLAPGNTLSLAGDYSAIGNLLGYLGSTRLQAWSSSAWETVDATNYADWLSLSYASGYTAITALSAIPEPGTYALLFGASTLVFALARHRRPA